MHLSGLSRQKIQPRNERLEEARRDVLVALLLEPRLPCEERVLEHGRAFGVVVDDVEVVGLIQLAGLGIGGLEHLRVLVVDHRLGDVDVLRQQQRHVERLVTFSKSVPASSPPCGPPP